MVRIKSGEIDMSASWHHARKPIAALLLAHGAGAGMDHRFMTSLAGFLCELNISTLRFNFPYIEKGRRAPESPKVAQQAIVDAVDFIANGGNTLPLFVGGKSYGGRMASHCAALGRIEISGLVFYGFPLHAPGKPSMNRADHLKDIKIPLLFLQGTNDQLAQIDLINEVCKGLGNNTTLKTFQSADHSFKVPKSSGIDPESMIKELAIQTRFWIEDVLK
ncbi:MAG: dienelactone hydrolase family protein [Bacteroidetes bacterium]|nr:dienelactone hydrolase family protein [Bacteroidota bacterium]